MKKFLANYKFSVLSIFILCFVYLFSVYIRIEDYYSWKKNPALFTYQNEYQLANIDCYYYLKMAKDYAHNQYTTVDSLRYVPKGEKRPAMIPLISWLAAFLHNIFPVSLSTIAAFLPAFLSSLLAPLVFLFLKKLQFKNISALVGAFLSIFSLTYVFRTRIGVFDTDCLNVIFLFNNSLLFYLLSKAKNVKLYLMLVIINTSLFLWWWNTANSVVFVSIYYTYFIYVVFFLQGVSVVKKTFFLVIPGLLGALFLKKEILGLISLVFLKNDGVVFPILSDISELTPVSFTEFIEKTTGNTFIFIVTMLGLAVFIWNQKKHALFLLIPTVFAFIGLFSGNRFLLFSAPILAFGGAFAVEYFLIKARYYFYAGAILAFLLVSISWKSNYQKITYKYSKPAAYDYIPMMSSIQTNTSDSCYILTDWDIGYLIQYYTNRGTYADGEITNRGDILYYTSLPLAQDNLVFAANFIHFYTNNPKGLEKLLKAGMNISEIMLLLQEIWHENIENSKKIIEQKMESTPVFKSMFSSSSEALKFFFPKRNKEVYLLLHQQMLQTVFWFKQGNINLETMQTMGMPLYLQFFNVTDDGMYIKNNDIIVNKQNGLALYQQNTQHAFEEIRVQHIDTFKLFQFKQASQNQFVFHYNSSLSYAAALSKEMSKSTFHQLFMLQTSSPYFKPIDLQSPLYQLWQIQGDEYLE